MLIRTNIKRFLALLGIFFVMLYSFSEICMANESMYEDFSDCNLIRFHIRAESNARIDQEAKMAVRQKVLEYLKKNAAKTEDKSEMRKFVLRHRVEMEQVIRSKLESYGMESSISIYFTKEFFPMRKYGQTIVPAGIYEALRIDLGKAAGRNWWCVLYPGLCLIDSEHVLENPEDKEKLEKILQDGSVKVKYKSYILEIMKKFSKKERDSIS
ncbi:MAG: stage II sporulation protein R [Lachnospiraceae bacterium]|nr:stage II sporulation protein R [Lachnospiraceae bacterium]